MNVGGRFSLEISYRRFDFNVGFKNKNVFLLLLNLHFLDVERGGNFFLLY